MTVAERVYSFPIKPAPLIRVNDPFLDENKITLYIKREDLIHPYIFGNKWYKLKYNLIEAEKQNYKTLLTFGGAYSNHLYAAAAAGRIFGFKTIGIIRGEEHLPQNHILGFACENGMILNYVSRSAYRLRAETAFIEKLHQVYGDFYLLPEGGSNYFAVKGCSEIPSTIDVEYDYIAAAMGTGGTLAGIIAGVPKRVKVLGFPVLKGARFLEEDMLRLLTGFAPAKQGNYEIFYDYHFGGYAKSDTRLFRFLVDTERIINFYADRIYFGKMLFGIYDLIGKRYFPENKTIIALNSAPVS
jgi:1-aminocyclopropane-1-carboxylate deaminase